MALSGQAGDSVTDELGGDDQAQDGHDRGVVLAHPHRQRQRSRWPGLCPLPKWLARRGLGCVDGFSHGAVAFRCPSVGRPGGADISEASRSPWISERARP
jgi:hypothetical protein